jgi:hypothetical protein
LALLLIFIQAQESVRLSKTAMVVAVLVFIAGVSLLVYFFRRYKRTEKELQDEWDRPEQSLFAPGVPLVDRDEGHRPREGAQALSSDAVENTELESETSTEPEPGSKPATVEPLPPAAALPLTRELQSDGQSVVLASTADTETTPHQTEVLSSEKSEPASTHIEVGSTVIDSAPSAEITQHPTELLSSETQPDHFASDASTESTLLDDDIWAALELPEPEAYAGTQRFGAETPPAEGEVGKREQATVSKDANEPVKPAPQTDMLGAARVDSHSGREGFEPPGFTRSVRQEPVTPEHIQATQRSVKPQITEPQPETRTRILGSSPAASERHAGIEGAAGADQSSAEIEAPVVAPAAADSAASIRVRAGSVLGLPAERSQAPLVLGAPVKPSDEIGIGALSNYGKDLEGGGGHGGTITLVVVILLLGGGIATYQFVPSVRSWVNATVERTRGIDPNPPAAIEQPKARVFAARNEANKNIVKARGAVDNISEETLSDLKLEVSLERGNGAPAELKTYPIKPSQLAPKERGIYEFEYDGNRATGFGGYRIVRLLSGESEVKFATPGRTG